MLDLKFIRENPDLVKAGIAMKNDRSDIDAVIKLDQDRREIIGQVEQLKAERNAASAEVAKKKKAGESADDLIEKMRAVGDKIAEYDTRLRTVEDALNGALSWIPNIPHDSVPVGPDASANKVVREWGEIPKPAFKVLPHWEIGARLNILDLDAAARISGSGFYLLRGKGALLQRALINYMLDTHTADGFVETIAPYLVNASTMYGTGQLPKFAEDMYKTEGDNMYLIPTAEVPLTNMFKDQTLSDTQLPMYIVGHSPCFRREAGSAGKDTRGMIRVHQFDKVELVKITHPDKSYEELETLVRQAEKILQGLKIPYRVVLLSSGDMTFASSKTYDLELWAAGVDSWLEISSISNFGDFQARRMNARFRDAEKKIRYVHTLNGSGVALARLIPAILENYQNADGSVTVPEALRPYMKGLDRIS
jgi:seryl-tRNA synthetase